MKLPELVLPQELNYIGVFLTFACNLNCSYCINDPKQEGKRRECFSDSKFELPPELWKRAFARIPARDDLPITLQGGEPSVYGNGRELGAILEGSDHKFDLLTNLALPTERFVESLQGQQDKLKREAPYPSIRVSYHAEQMNRAWKGHGIETLVERCLALGEHGFDVSPVKAESDVGIYVVDHPQNRDLDHASATAAGKVPLETKEFLGLHEGRLHGTYLYPLSTNLVASGYRQSTLSCECRTTELLIDPLGFVWRCHFFLYESWIKEDLSPLFQALERNRFDFSAAVAETTPLTFMPIGHILDPDFGMEALSVYRPCSHYGRCIGCDTKVKNDRFQSLYDFNRPHTSVQMRNIRMPVWLIEKTVPRETAKRMIDAGVLCPIDDDTGERTAIPDKEIRFG